jgi:thiol-disulfide isomerase/thioredoxin
MNLLDFMLGALLLSVGIAEPVDITTDDFDTFIAGRPTFVKFFSPNCPHCRNIAPVWEKVASVAPTYPQAFQVGDVDCTSETILCERFGIRGVPSLIFFNDGRMYKYAGKREYNDIMKFGAGDFKDALESAEIPPMGGSGIAGQTAYTVYKFVKDIMAMIRFNFWAVLFFVLLGAVMGSLVTFAIMLANLTREVESLRAADREQDQMSSSEEAESVAAEKPIEMKKVD